VRASNHRLSRVGALKTKQRQARPGEINGDFIDRFTLAHLASGVALGMAGASVPFALLLGALWEVAEGPLKNSYPTAFPYPSQDAPANQLGDILAVAGGAILAQLLTKNRTKKEDSMRSEVGRGGGGHGGGGGGGGHRGGGGGGHRPGGGGGGGRRHGGHHGGHGHGFYGGGFYGPVIDDRRIIIDDEDEADADEIDQAMRTLRRAPPHLVDRILRRHGV